jgi:hypothetical protein
MCFSPLASQSPRLPQLTVSDLGRENRINLAYTSQVAFLMADGCCSDFQGHLEFDQQTPSLQTDSYTKVLRHLNLSQVDDLLGEKNTNLSLSKKKGTWLLIFPVALSITLHGRGSKIENALKSIG